MTTTSAVEGGLVCRCVKRHSPVPRLIEVHHVLPLSWGGTTTSPDTMGPGINTVDVCPTTHYNIHQLLNLYLHTNGKPDPVFIKSFGPFVHNLADVAWNNRIQNHPTPFWLPEHGATDHPPAR